MAIAERRDIKDYVGIYYTKDWKLVNVREYNRIFKIKINLLI